MSSDLVPFFIPWRIHARVVSWRSSGATLRAFPFSFFRTPCRQFAAPITNFSCLISVIHTKESERVSHVKLILCSRNNTLYVSQFLDVFLPFPFVLHCLSSFPFCFLSEVYSFSLRLRSFKFSSHHFITFEFCCLLMLLAEGRGFW